MQSSGSQQHDQQQHDFAGDKTKLGDWLQEVGDYEGAPKVYQEAKEVFVALYGCEHPEVASAHENMGLVHKIQGDPDKARGMFATVAKT